MKFNDKKEQLFFYFVLVFGFFTLGVNIYRIFTAKNSTHFMVLGLETVAGIALIFLPIIFTKLTKLEFPTMVRLYYWFFLWIAVFLGTGLRFIGMIPFWDKILHAVSPMLLVAVGYALIGYFLRDTDFTKISPWLFLVFGFAFAGLCGVFWEFWECLCDQLFDMNLQRYLHENGQPFIGRAALMDTMGDLIVNTIGALILTAYSFFKRNDENYFKQYAFTKVSVK